MNSNILIEHVAFTDFCVNELTGFLAEVLEALRIYFELKVAHSTVNKQLCSRKNVGSKWSLRSVCANLTGECDY
jgi:hypothetical protein